MTVGFCRDSPTTSGWNPRASKRNHVGSGAGQNHGVCNSQDQGFFLIIAVCRSDGIFAMHFNGFPQSAAKILYQFFPCGSLTVNAWKFFNPADPPLFALLDDCREVFHLLHCIRSIIGVNTHGSEAFLASERLQIKRSAQVSMKLIGSYPAPPPIRRASARGWRGRRHHRRGGDRRRRRGRFPPPVRGRGPRPASG